MTLDPEVDALVADRYLDALLAVGDHEAHPGVLAVSGTPDGSGFPGADVRDAVRVLRASLVRVHPSFRFEERLARRLADLAAAQAAPAVASAGAGGGALIPFPGAARVLDVDPLLDAILRGDLDPADADAVERAAGSGSVRRPLIVGGAAITSAAISIAGVVYVAWRASRPTGGGRSNHAMARAARSARARRASAAAGFGVRSLGGPA